MRVTEIVRTESKQVRYGEIRIALEANEFKDLGDELAKESNGPLFKAFCDGVAEHIKLIKADLDKPPKPEEPIDPAEPTKN